MSSEHSVTGAYSPLMEPETPTPQKNRAVGIGVAVMVAAVVALVVVLWPKTPPAPTPPAPGVQTGAETFDVSYKVSTSGGASVGTVTYATPGGQSQATGQGGSWSFTGTFAGSDKAYVSVQNGSGSGTVLCEIDVDGTQLSSNTAEGGYAIATCTS